MVDDKKTYINTDIIGITYKMDNEWCAGIKDKKQIVILNGVKQVIIYFPHAHNIHAFSCSVAYIKLLIRPASKSLKGKI